MNKNDIKKMYDSVLNTYECIMTHERREWGKKSDPQWSNIMKSMLSLMLSTDADDAFLEEPEKMTEYDQMLKKYLGMPIPSHG